MRKNLTLYFVIFFSIVICIKLSLLGDILHIGRIALIVIAVLILLAIGMLYVFYFIANKLGAYADKTSPDRLKNEQCDPQAYLKTLERRQRICPKKYRDPISLQNNRAVAFILMGEFEKAKQALLEIDKMALPDKDNKPVGHEMNLVLCLYELGEIEQAEKIHEKVISEWPSQPGVTSLTLNIMDAERFFFLGRYEESKSICKRILLDPKINKLVRLNMLYRLAQIDEKYGDLVSAKEKYEEVANEGNKLWKAVQARSRVERLSVASK